MSRSELVNPGRRLPDVQLPLASGGPPQRLRAAGRKNPVLVLLHAASCAVCREYLHQLAAEEDEIREWDGVVRIIVTGRPDAATLPPLTSLPFPVLLDPETRVGTALSLHPPAVVVADQWGEIHEARGAGDAHAFPSPAEVIRSLRYLATQCPECQGEAL